MHIVKGRETFALNKKAEVLAVAEFEFKRIAKEEIFRFSLETPIAIEANQEYTVGTIISGDRTQYGKEGMETVTVEGVQFTFGKALKKYDNATGVSMGQIPELIFYK